MITTLHHTAENGAEQAAKATASSLERWAPYLISLSKILTIILLR
jgi:hypothetical protein